MDKSSRLLLSQIKIILACPNKECLIDPNLSVTVEWNPSNDLPQTTYLEVGSRIKCFGALNIGLQKVHLQLVKGFRC